MNDLTPHSTAQTLLRARLNDSRDALSPSTLRALEWGLLTWGRTCDALNVCPLPAAPQAVADAFKGPLLAHLAPASLGLVRWAIGWAHLAAELPDPTSTLVVRLALKARRRGRGAQRQVAPFTRTILAEVERMMGPGGDFETDRDRALFRLLYDTALRRSEAVACDATDLHAEADGSGRLLIRRSKTDQTGEGALLYVAPDTMQRIAAYLTHHRDPGEPALWVSVRGRRLLGADVARILKRRLHAAGLPATHYAGHSPRVGLAHDLVAAGIDVAAVMAQGRWRSPAMVARYTRALAAGRSASAQLAVLQGRISASLSHGDCKPRED